VAGCAPCASPLESASEAALHRRLQAALGSVTTSVALLVFAAVVASMDLVWALLVQGRHALLARKPSCYTAGWASDTQRRTGSGASLIAPSAGHAASSAAALLLASVVMLFTPPGVSAVVSHGERRGLANLYTATNGTGWKGITRGWHNHADASVDPCDPPTTVWTGVTCSGVTSITYV
jgi:hypothetical protein